MHIAFLQNMGWPDLIIILIVALLIFGHRLPSVMRGVGRSMGELRKGLRETQEEMEGGAGGEGVEGIKGGKDPKGDAGGPAEAEKPGGVGLAGGNGDPAGPRSCSPGS